jgi:hypothetical protein
MNRKNLDADFMPRAGGFTATVTTEMIDRDGEVVIAQGMNASEYLTNPVLFYNHDYNLPVGKCLSLERRPTSIVADFKFAERPDDFEGPFFPEFVASMVGQGIVRGVSIGYTAENGGIRRATPDDRKRWGDSVHTVFNKWKLMEISVAPMQCNPGALISAVRKGAVDAEAARRWGGYVEPARRTVVVAVPALAWAARAARKSPIDSASIARAEIARAKGLLR